MGWSDREKHRFKTKPGRPRPDELKISLAGHPIPDRMRGAAEWSAEPRGFRTPEKRSGPSRPKLQQTPSPMPPNVGVLGLRQEDEETARTSWDEFVAEWTDR